MRGCQMMACVTQSGPRLRFAGRQAAHFGIAPVRMLQELEKQALRVQIYFLTDELPSLL